MQGFVPKLLLSSVVFTLTLVGSVWALRSLGTDDAVPPVVPAPAPKVGEAAVAPPVVTNLPIEAAPPNAVVAPAVGSRKGALKLPDGTTREALNGVTEDLVVPWPAGYPYSPIVAQETNAGTEWYRHADGSFTTTIVRTETVSGKVMQIPLCYTPKPGAVKPVMRQQ